MDDKRPIKVIKKADKPKELNAVDPRFIERHELSLLELLAIKHPERARLIVSRLKASVDA